MCSHGHGFLEYLGVLGHGLVGHLGQGAPDLPGAGLVGVLLHLGLDDEMFDHVPLAVGSRNLLPGLGVAREALDAGDADDGLLDEAQGLVRGVGLVGDAEVGEARVAQGVLVADELPLGADVGGAGVDGGREELEELVGADAPQGLAVAGRHGLAHLDLQGLGGGHGGALACAEDRPFPPPVFRGHEVHAYKSRQGGAPVPPHEPDHLAEFDRRARPTP